MDVNAMIWLCTAVPERESWVDYLRLHVPGLRVVYDRGAGPWTSWMHAWTTEPAEARVIIQDDVCLTVGAAGRIKVLTDLHPGRVIQFFDRYTEATERGVHESDPKTWAGSLCYYLPPGLGAKIGAFAVRRRADRAWRGFDDMSMREYLTKEHISYLAVSPSLVEHHPGPSKLGKRPHDRHARIFWDPELTGYPDPEPIRRLQLREP